MNVVANHKYLEELFYNPKISSTSFTGKSRLLKKIKDDRRRISPSELQVWLEKQRTYTLHKPRRKQFERSKIKTFYIDELWQLDLAEVGSVAQWNENVKYLLFAIDTFSKYLWVEPCLRKNATSVTAAFDAILQRSGGRIPKLIHTDQDTAFTSKLFQDRIVKLNNIHFYTSYDSSIKAAIVERVIRTMKLRLTKYMTAHNTNRYIDVLNLLVKNYNDSFHRSIGMAPSSVKKVHEKKIFQRMFPKYGKRTQPRRRKFQRGDIVRIAKKQGIFSKEGQKKWSEELFRINRFKERRPPYRYTIREWDGSEVVGSFYEHELQKVKANDSFIVEKVLRQKTTPSGKKEVLVKWLGYPSKYNSWQAEDTIRDIRGTIF